MKGNTLVAVVIVALIIAVLGLGGYVLVLKKNTEPVENTSPVVVPTPTPVTPAPVVSQPVAPATTYTDTQTGWSVKWDGSVFKKINDPLGKSPLVLVHEIARPTYNEATGAKTSDVTSNPAVFFSILPQSYTDTLRLLRKQYGSLDAISKPITYGGRSGTMTEMGAEGEGIIDYYLPLSSGMTLHISRNFISESSFTVYNNVPGFFTYDKQAQVTEAVLKTLTFTK